MDDLAVSSPLILLVDDFSDALEMYTEYLRFRGYRVATAATGAEAVAIAHGPDRPALILMDLEMGGMTGTAAMHLVRADPALAGVPILAFTAHALEFERRMAIGEGFDDVIAKPCLPDDLVTRITPYLEKHKSESV